MEFQIIQVTKRNYKKYLKEMLALQDTVKAGMSVDAWYIMSDEDAVIDYIKHGGTILLQIYDDRITAVSAAGEDSMELQMCCDNGIIIPGEKIYYHRFVYVDLEFRGNHTERELMGKTANKAKDMGYDTIWCIAHPDNIPSVRSIESVGYKKIAEFMYDGNLPRNVYVKDLR